MERALSDVALLDATPKRSGTNAKDPWLKLAKDAYSRSTSYFDNNYKQAVGRQPADVPVEAPARFEVHERRVQVPLAHLPPEVALSRAQERSHGGARVLLQPRRRQRRSGRRRGRSSGVGSARDEGAAAVPAHEDDSVVPDSHRRVPGRDDDRHRVLAADLALPGRRWRRRRSRASIRCFGEIDGRDRLTEGDRRTARTSCSSRRERPLRPGGALVRRGRHEPVSHHPDADVRERRARQHGERGPAGNSGSATTRKRCSRRASRHGPDAPDA
jgi:hypothetical protein